MAVVRVVHDGKCNSRLLALLSHRSFAIGGTLRIGTAMLKINCAHHRLKWLSTCWRFLNNKIAHRDGYRVQGFMFIHSRQAKIRIKLYPWKWVQCCTCGLIICWSQNLVNATEQQRRVWILEFFNKDLMIKLTRKQLVYALVLALDTLRDYL